ncbi:hypothetical protein X743_28565 [Mesorhizobium sp. LNHC252B00]|nr:hypothetical protein X743_28565 [Mesorhizobium sp. LNHC252B00]
MTRACEAVLKKRLLAPAGYKRVETSENSEPIPLEDYLKDRDATTESDRVLWTRMYSDDSGRKNPPTKFTLFIAMTAPTPMERRFMAFQCANTDPSQPAKPAQHGIR